MDFLELFDACVRETKPRLDKYTKPKSLDVTLTLVLISDIYGIPEADDFNIPVGSLREVREYMLENKNKDFDSVEAAMESVT